MNNDNSQSVRVTTEAYKNRHVMCSFFRDGYESVIKSKPFNYDIVGKVDAIHYERGRAFAIWSLANKQPRAVWRKGVAAKTVMDRFVRATQVGAVI